MTIDYDARVAVGAALLDERFPNWEADVELGDLDQASPQFCVAAQIVCDSDNVTAYAGAMAELGIKDYPQACAHGFAMLGAESERRRVDLGIDATVTEIYAPLTDAWRRLITSRLAPLEAAL